jgi:hypothetical protein
MKLGVCMCVCHVPCSRVCARNRVIMARALVDRMRADVCACGAKLCALARRPTRRERGAACWLVLN